MKPRRAFILFIALLPLSGCSVAKVTEPIADARYADPVERYGHFALGKPHEYASLVVTTQSGRSFTLQLPDDEVFEDLAPRRVKLAKHEPDALLTVVSQRDSGARLVLIQAHDSGLSIRAQSPAIGMSNRWLNPVGVADLDGDGRAEIAAVITPHIGGTLKIYRQMGNKLVEVTAMSGFSNHAYGSTELGLSTPTTISGKPFLLVPDTTRTQLRIMTLNNNQLVNAGRCELNAPITGAIHIGPASKVSVFTRAGQQSITLEACLE